LRFLVRRICHWRSLSVVSGYVPQLAFCIFGFNQSIIIIIFYTLGRYIPEGV